MSTCGGGSGPLCTCFSDINIQGLYYAQRQDYAASWELFRRVELYNSNVSTQRGEGNTTLNYWQFETNEEQTLYRQGGFLFAYYLGYTSTVQKN